MHRRIELQSSSLRLQSLAVAQSRLAAVRREHSFVAASCFASNGSLLRNQAHTQHDSLSLTLSLSLAHSITQSLAHSRSRRQSHCREVDLCNCGASDTDQTHDDNQEERQRRRIRVRGQLRPIVNRSSSRRRHCRCKCATNRVATWRCGTARVCMVAAPAIAHTVYEAELQRVAETRIARHGVAAAAPGGQLGCLFAAFDGTVVARLTAHHAHHSAHTQKNEKIHFWTLFFSSWPIARSKLAHAAARRRLQHRQ